MKRWWIIGLGVVVPCVVVGGFLLRGGVGSIPVEIRRQVSTAVFLPARDESPVARDTVKFDAPTKLLTFTTTYQDIELIVSQQPTPESFVDIPQVYEKVVEGMHEYAKFDSVMGTAHLTRPPEAGGKQAAVLNAKGTLMFVKPAKDLSDDQWRRWFNRLSIEP